MSEHTIGSADRARTHAKALAWLDGEDAYQHGRHGKFSLEADTSYLEMGLLYGSWGNQFYNNYNNKLRIAERNKLWSQALQAAGKIAASARGLYVTLVTLQQPVDVWALANQTSLAILRDFSAEDSDGRFSYEAATDIVGTPFEDRLQELHDALPVPFDTARMPNDTERLAHRALREGYYFFIDKIVHVEEVTQRPARLPRPGVPSGDIQSW